MAPASIDCTLDATSASPLINLWADGTVRDGVNSKGVRLYNWPWVALFSSGDGEAHRVSRQPDQVRHYGGELLRPWRRTLLCHRLAGLRRSDSAQGSQPE
jgi:hypothetical protein